MTPTSSAVGYYLLPSEDYSSATLTTDPDEVIIGHTLAFPACLDRSFLLQSSWIIIFVM